jgi:hypothetical protein
MIWKMQCKNCDVKVVENQEVMMPAMKWYCLHSLAPVTCVKVKVIRPHFDPRKVMEVNEAEDEVEVVVVAVAIKEDES